MGFDIELVRTNKTPGQRKNEEYDEFNPISEKVYRNRKFLVNILSEPDTDSQVIRKLYKWQTFIIIDFVKNEHGSWRKIFFKSCIGYISCSVPISSLAESAIFSRNNLKKFYIFIILSIFAEVVINLFWALIDLEINSEINIFIIITIILVVIACFVLSDVFDKR